MNANSVDSKTESTEKLPYEGDYEDFNKKKEWFYSKRPETLGRNLTEFIWSALEHAKILDLQDDLVDDPGGNNPGEGFEVVNPYSFAFRIQTIAQPEPEFSRGYASKCFSVNSDEENLEEVIVKFSLDTPSLNWIEPTTIKVFQYQPESRYWAMVSKSGVKVDKNYGWVTVNEPGTFVAIGLPKHPQGFAEFLECYNHRNELREAVQKTDSTYANFIQRLIENVALELAAGLKNDPATAAMMNPEFNPPLNGNYTFLPSKMPAGGFPEFQILEMLLGQSPNDKKPIHTPLPHYAWQNTKMKTALAASWSTMGPDNFNGRIKSLIMHPTDSSILWAGAANGGVWKTTDGGLSWTSTFLDEETMAIGSIAVCETNPTVLYAGSGEATPGWGPSYPGTGVYKSINGGDNWTKCTSLGAFSDLRTTKIMVHPTDPNIVYVATGNGFFKSINGGSSWTLIQSGYMCDALMDPTTPETIFSAIWSNGVYKSINGGTNWTLTRGTPTVLPSGTSADWIKLAMGRNGANGTSFILAKMGTNSAYLYKSLDSGVTWAQFPSAYGAYNMNEWTSVLAVNPNDHDNLFAGAYYLQFSIDGLNFNYANSLKPDMQAIIFDPNDVNSVWVACDSGIFKSTDKGANFSWMGQGLIATQLYSLGVSQTGAFTLGAATHDQGIILSNGTPTWSNANAGNEGGIYAIDPNDSSIHFCSPFNYGLRISKNSGATWQTLSDLFMDVVNGVNTIPAVISSIAICPGNSNLILATGTISTVISGSIYVRSYIYRSTDQGTSWTKVLTVPVKPTELVFAPTTGTVAYMGPFDGSLYQSIDSGSTWTKKTTFKTVVISAIAVSFSNTNTVYISYGGLTTTRAAKTTNGGGKWTDVTGKIANTKLPIVPTTDLVLDQFNDSIVYLGTDIGIFRSTDSGTNWSNFNIGIPRIVVTQIQLQKSTNTLYASTMGRGVYQRAL